MSKLLRQRVISKAKQDEIGDVLQTNSKDGESQLFQNDDKEESTLSSEKILPDCTLSSKQIIKIEEAHGVVEKRNGLDSNGSSMTTVLIDNSDSFFSSVMNNNKSPSTSIGSGTKNLNSASTKITVSLGRSKQSTCVKTRFGAKKNAIILDTRQKSPNSENSSSSEKAPKMVGNKNVNSTSKKRTAPSTVVTNNAKKQNVSNNNKKGPSKRGKAKGKSNTKVKGGDKNNPKLKKEESVDQEQREGDTPPEDGTEEEGTKSNIYDAILAECRGLLHAAHEAQAFGRLKMASTYLLLLHARLIGLGKRFDRSGMSLNSHLRNIKTVTPSPPVMAEPQLDGSTIANSFQTSTQPTQAPQATGSSETTPPPISSPIKKEEEKKPIDIDNIKSIPPQPLPVATENNSPMKENDTFLQDIMHSSDSMDSTKEAAQALAKCLPSNINLDSTMMEHLAKAAIELHNKRTGKKSTGTNASVPSGGSVAWTEQEKKDCWKAAETYGAQNISQIMKAMKTHRTEAQVKAHLRNVVGKTEKMKQFAGTVLTLEEVPSNQIEVESNKSNFAEREKIEKTNRSEKLKQKSNATTTLITSQTNKTTTRDGNIQSQLQVSESNDCTSVQGENSSPVTTTKRGGRFKKAPSVAVHTVANASFDARAMLMGKNLK